MMFVSATSYRGRTLARNRSHALKAGAVMVLAVVVSGCAGTGLPLREFDRNTAQAALQPARPIKASLTVSDTVAPSDWEAIRRTIASSPADGSGSFEWSNPGTGSKGVIAILAAEIIGGTSWCRPFATTVNDIRGIRRYRGQACLRTDGRWQLSDMSPDDSKIL